MDRDLDLLTSLLLDPFLTVTEARQEAAAAPTRLRRPAPATARGVDGERQNPRARPLAPALDF